MPFERIASMILNCNVFGNYSVLYTILYYTSIYKLTVIGLNNT